MKVKGIVCSHQQILSFRHRNCYYSLPAVFLKGRSRCTSRHTVQNIFYLCCRLIFFQLKHAPISIRHPQKSATKTLCTHKICAVIAKPSMWRAPHLLLSLCLSLHSPSESQGWCHCSATGGVTLPEQGDMVVGFGEGRGGGAWRVIGWDRLLSSDPTPLGTTLLPIVSISHSGFFSFLWRSFTIRFQFY